MVIVPLVMEMVYVTDLFVLRVVGCAETPASVEIVSYCSEVCLRMQLARHPFELVVLDPLEFSQFVLLKLSLPLFLVLADVLLSLVHLLTHELFDGAFVLKVLGGPLLRFFTVATQLNVLKNWSLVLDAFELTDSFNLLLGTATHKSCSIRKPFEVSILWIRMNNLVLYFADVSN